jgi:mRNA interferase MazF
VSRQALISTRFSTVICAPIFTKHDALSTQVEVGIDEGLKHDSSVHCDELVSLPKTMLTNYVGVLPPEKIIELDSALKIALDLRD